MIGMLTRSPRRRCTPGWPREGRLDLADRPEFGTNVIPLQMSREELRDGYVGVMNELYEPEAYFDRLDDLYPRREARHRPGPGPLLAPAPAGSWLKTQSLFLAQAIGLFARLMRGVPDPALRREYRRRLWRLLKVRRDPGVLLYLHAQVRDALPRLHDGQADGHRPEPDRTTRI